MLEVFFNEEARGGRPGMWGSEPTGQREKKTVDPFPSDNPAQSDRPEKEPADPAEARLGILGLLQDRWLFSLCQAGASAIDTASSFGEVLDLAGDTNGPSARPQVLASFLHSVK
jgi:hypothetical protein